MVHKLTNKEFWLPSIIMGGNHDVLGADLSPIHPLESVIGRLVIGLDQISASLHVTSLAVLYHRGAGLLGHPHRGAGAST